uniref:ANK_REP_REGION domain-containing protein n=1 Tax=Steinernema glaseri TaxID=37863 RepID=A0A1I7ZIB4_9BILA
MPSTPLFPREESLGRFRQSLQDAAGRGEKAPLAIVAPRGAGKTSFIRMLDSDPCVIAVHFCRTNDAYSTDRCVLIQSISKQLMQTFPNLVLPAISPLTLLLGGEEIIEDFIAVPLAYLPRPAKTMCVIIDDPSAKVLKLVIKLSEILPSWLRVCIASRECPKGFDSFYLDQNQTELHKFAYSTFGKSPDVDKFVSRAQGSWFNVAIHSTLHRLKVVPPTSLAESEPVVTVLSEILPQRVSVYLRLVATAKRPPTTNRLLDASQLALPNIKIEDVNQEVHLLEKLLGVDESGWLLREELTELAEPLAEGHAIWADYCINRGGETAQEIALIAYHMAHSPSTSFPDRVEILKLLGAEEIEFRCDIFDGPTTTLLLEAGAKKSAVTPDFVYNCAIGDKNLVSERLTKQRPETLALGLIAAASRGHAEICSLILEVHPESAHFVDYYQWNALRSAACNNHLNILDMLVKYGINVDECGPGGRTALRAAAWSGHPIIVKRLLQEKADVNKCDTEGRSALMAAAFMDHADIVKMLIEFGGNTNLVDNSGATALHLALSNNSKTTEHKATILNLLEGSSDVNATDRHERNCLHLAAYHGEPTITAIIELSRQLRRHSTAFGALEQFQDHRTQGNHLEPAGRRLGRKRH